MSQSKSKKHKNKLKKKNHNLESAVHNKSPSLRPLQNSSINRLTDPDDRPKKNDLQIFSKKSKLHQDLDAFITLIHLTLGCRYGGLPSNSLKRGTKNSTRDPVKFLDIIDENYPGGKFLEILKSGMGNNFWEFYTPPLNNEHICKKSASRLAQLIDVKTNQFRQDCTLQRCCSAVSWLDPQDLNPLVKQSIPVPYVLTTEFLNSKFFISNAKKSRSHMLSARRHRLISELFREILSSFLTIDLKEAADYCYYMKLKRLNLFRTVSDRKGGETLIYKSDIDAESIQFFRSYHAEQNWPLNQKSRKSEVLDMVFKLFKKILDFVEKYEIYKINSIVSASKKTNSMTFMMHGWDLDIEGFRRNLESLMIYKYHILKKRLTVPSYLEAVTNFRVIRICRDYYLLQRENEADAGAVDRDDNPVWSESDFTLVD